MERGGEWQQGFRSDELGGLVLDEATRVFKVGPGVIDEDRQAEQTLWAARIHRKYTDLEELRYGWTFCGSSGNRIYDADVAIIGLNPGGGDDGRFELYGEIWDCPAGNAYYDEFWSADGKSYNTLQLQVHAWHNLLDRTPHQTLCAQFVPFRSSSWSKLPRKKECLAFSEQLWGELLSVSPARRLITMGKLPAVCLAQILGAERQSSLPVGWGAQRIDVWQCPDGRRIIGMPHPGRFALLSRRAASETAQRSFLLATSMH